MSEALDNQKEKELSRCVAGITTYTLGSYTKDDSFVRVGYALSSVGLGTAFDYANVRIPKLDNGEIDTTNFIVNLGVKLSIINQHYYIDDGLINN
tara:strand:+ start:1989 stop:2273 length:285 start_codon:yes stop_codon:yes gene_type:complete